MTRTHAEQSAAHGKNNPPADQLVAGYDADDGDTRDAGRRVALVVATTTGGTGRHVASLAEGLVRAGSRVVVAGPSSTEEQFRFTRTGARFVSVEIASGPRPVADLRAWARLRTVLRGADLVHAHGLRAGLLAGLATPRSIPFVVTWHNAVLADGPLRTIYAQLEQVVARRADITLCVSPDLEARVRQLGGRDVRPGPVAAPTLPPPSRSVEEVRAEFGLPPERPLVVTVARLSPQKGLHTLIEAAAAFPTTTASGAPRAYPPLFVVAGDGPQRAELEERITVTGAPVRLLGARNDVPDLLAAADVVTLPSQWEGSPLIAQEALRAGRPFVGTAVGGVPSLVGDAGELVPPGDPAALAAALASVLDNPDHAARLVERAAARIPLLPTPESTIAQIRAVYAELA